MKLYFVRHGQSKNNYMYIKNQSYRGRVADPEITDVGQQQMTLSGQFLKSCLFGGKTNNGIQPWDNKKTNGFLYCSLLERSIQSGVILSEQLGLPLMVNVDIHENGGMFDYYEENNERIGRPGRTKKEILEKYPNLIMSDGINSGSWWNKPFEDMEKSRMRAFRLIDELNENHSNPNDHVIWVSHGDFYNTFLQCLISIKRDDVWFDMYNGAVTLIEFESDGIKIVFDNYFGFLPDNLIT